jgi:ferredoxin-NADP reductase
VAKLTATLDGRERIADATYAFTFDLNGQPFSYKPGQTVDVTFPDPPISDAAGNRRTFSLASAPGRDDILIASRVRGSGFKRSLVEAPLGTALELDGPYGSFTLPSKPADVVMLAGGVGVTPFRSMAEDAIERSLDHTLTLIHSNRAPEETPFLLELLNWATRNERFRYVPTMTQAEKSARGWDGERRRVNAESLDGWLPKERNAPLYYVAGPERFVKGAVDALAAVGVDEERIRFEEFPGY